MKSFKEYILNEGYDSMLDFEIEIKSSAQTESTLKIVHKKDEDTICELTIADQTHKFIIPLTDTHKFFFGIWGCRDDRWKKHGKCLLRKLDIVPNSTEDTEQVYKYAIIEPYHNGASFQIELEDAKNKVVTRTVFKYQDLLDSMAKSMNKKVENLF